MPDEQVNERSALVMLALLGLEPQMTWTEAGAPLLGVTQIMGWIRDVYGKSYAPNTRETIRKSTIHQLVAAGVLAKNPDAPDRPVNSPRTAYQIEQHALEVVLGYQGEGFDEQLAAYLRVLPALRERWAAEREGSRIPVVLPSGQPVSLSAGGQNILIAKMVEYFCPVFTPAGVVAYIGDADEKWAVSFRR